MTRESIFRGMSALGGAWADTPSEIHGILQDTVNKRAVRIILEFNDWSA